jgi:hypothetical protein
MRWINALVYQAIADCARGSGKFDHMPSFRLWPAEQARSTEYIG